MSNDSATAAPSTSEEAHELIRQLVDGRFVLTDRDGGVTRWSKPAQELFGWTSARMIGRPLGGDVGLPELPPAGGQLQVTGHGKDERELQLTLTLVPVGMSRSLEFNGFLEALEMAAPRGAALTQLAASNPAVVDWIAAAVEGRAELGDDPVAGMIVAFDAPPPELHGLSELRAEVESLRGGLDQTGEALRQAMEVTGVLRAELAATRAVIETLQDQRANEREQLAAELDLLRESFRPDAPPATEPAPELEAKLARVDEAVTLTQRLIAEAGALRRSLDESLHGRGYEAPPALRPFDSNGTPRAAGAPHREPRPGFDDAPQPMATFGIDGHFRELNQAFSELVGYPELEFRAAVWPPVTDRGSLAKHRELLKKLLDGKIEAAEIDTAYLHAQGLLVPVVGTISLVRDEDGVPEHFVLSVEPAA